jgi:hypothetical protein
MITRVNRGHRLTPILGGMLDLFLDGGAGLVVVELPQLIVNVHRGLIHRPLAADAADQGNGFVDLLHNLRTLHIVAAPGILIIDYLDGGRIRAQLGQTSAPGPAIRHVVA